MLGSDTFIDRVMDKIKYDKRDLLEVPAAQRRPEAQEIEYYAGRFEDRDQAIVATYHSGGYTMKEIGDYFGLHYSRVSRILKKAEAKNKT